MQAQSYILHNKKNSNHQSSSTSTPNPSTATCSNPFNSDQTSSTSSPHPLTASPINKTSNHQSSSTSRPNPSTATCSNPFNSDPYMVHLLQQCCPPQSESLYEFRAMLINCITNCSSFNTFISDSNPTIPIAQSYILHNKTNCPF